MVCTTAPLVPAAVGLGPPLGVGGSVWESNPPVPAFAATPTDLKSARVTGPRALPVRIINRITPTGRGENYRVVATVSVETPGSNRRKTSIDEVDGGCDREQLRGCLGTVALHRRKGRTLAP